MIGWQTRYSVVIMCFLATFICYIDRVNISIAIIPMAEELGWDKIRDARIASQRKLGLLKENEEPSPRPDHVPAWNELSEPRRTFEEKRMTALAAMIDRVDQELGRLLEDLEAQNELSNTFILFVSDNGACPYDRVSRFIEQEPTRSEVSWSDSTGWAWARNAPFRYYKQNQFEGGIATPAIVHWPAGLTAEKGSITDQPAHLVDVLPTLADLCRAEMPDRWPNRQLKPIAGVSLRPVLAGQEMKERPPIHLLFGNDRGLRDGDWKLVSFKGGPWELYNLANDRTERNNLASKYPDRVQAMSEQWTTMTMEVLEAPKKAFEPVSQRAKPHQHPQWTNFEVDPKSGAPGFRKK